MHLEEIDFEPPHNLEIYDVIYDGATLSFLTETGRSVTMRGEMRFLSTSFTDDDDIPDRMSGIFCGIYEADDFCYPVEIHITDTYGRIYKRPRPIPECIKRIDTASTHITLVDPAGTILVCLRDPACPWEPARGKVVVASAISRFV